MAATQAPTAAFCDEVHPAELDVRLQADPPDPEVGDEVMVDAQLVNTTGGPAGIPLFQLTGAEPCFAIEEQESSYPSVEFVRYRLRAVRAGQTQLRLSVNFETSFACVDAPMIFFRSADSPPYLLMVRGDAITTPTPTGTPLPQSPMRATPRPRESGPPPTVGCAGDRNRDGRVTIDEWIAIRIAGDSNCLAPGAAVEGMMDAGAVFERALLGCAEPLR